MRQLTDYPVIQLKQPFLLSCVYIKLPKVENPRVFHSPHFSYSKNVSFPLCLPGRVHQLLVTISVCKGKWCAIRRKTASMGSKDVCTNTTATTISFWRKFFGTKYADLSFLYHLFYYYLHNLVSLLIQSLFYEFCSVQNEEDAKSEKSFIRVFSYRKASLCAMWKTRKMGGRAYISLFNLNIEQKQISKTSSKCLLYFCIFAKTSDKM